MINWEALIHAILVTTILTVFAVCLTLGVVYVLYIIGILDCYCKI